MIICLWCPIDLRHFQCSSIYESTVSGFGPFHLACKYDELVSQHTAINIWDLHILNIELRHPLFSTDASFSLHFLSDHGSHFSVDTSSNIRPLRAVSIISLSLILVLTACIETARKRSRLLSYFAILSTTFSPCNILLKDPLGLQTLLDYIELLSERWDIYLKIQLTYHKIIIFLLEAPHFSKATSIFLKTNSWLPPSNITLKTFEFIQADFNEMICLSYDISHEVKT